MELYIYIYMSLYIYIHELVYVYIYELIYIYIYIYICFPGGSVVKNLPGMQKRQEIP